MLLYTGSTAEQQGISVSQTGFLLPYLSMTLQWLRIDVYLLLAAVQPVTLSKLLNLRAEACLPFVAVTTCMELTADKDSTYL